MMSDPGSRHGHKTSSFLPAYCFHLADDRVGAVVMDENRVFGSDLDLVNNMGAMVKRDRNHPSVAIWSFCNVSVPSLPSC